jgi:hypothetical protein
MNNKKAKKIRKLVEMAYGEKYSPEFVNSVYKKIKKEYSKLSTPLKSKIIEEMEEKLEDSKFLLSIINENV